MHNSSKSMKVGLVNHVVPSIGDLVIVFLLAMTDWKRLLGIVLSGARDPARWSGIQ